MCKRIRSENLVVADKKAITEDIIKSLKPSIRKALIQTPPSQREDLEQELYLKIIKKISEEDIEKLPGFFELLEDLNK